MPLAAHIDFEGAAPGDLRKQGVHRWVEHPETQCWCMSWRLGSLPVQRWHPGDPDPAPLLDHVHGGGRTVAHNAAFERTVWNKHVRKRIVPHWPELTIRQQDCTMARCAVLAIPGSLDVAAQVLGLRARKDEEGRKLMLQMARPRNILECPFCTGSGCGHCRGCGQVFFWWNDPERVRRLGTYCDQDVIAESELDERVPPLSARERVIWELDQEINDRGIRLDLFTIGAARKVVDHAKHELNKRMDVLTGGYVRRASEIGALAEWLMLHGVDFGSVAKDKQEEILLVAELLDVPLVQEAVELRRQASKASTAKLTTMLSCVCEDGRARGQVQYHGASTGRWAGRLIQPQNLYRTDPERDGDDIERTIAILQIGHLSPAQAHDCISMIVGEPMTAIAKCMRSMFIASPGRRFVGGDESNIEGCVNAWVNGEEWKVQAYRDYQAGVGPDTYRLAYSRSFGVAIDKVTGAQRQIGKVEELALGYQGSVGAFATLARTYLMKLSDIMPVVRAATDPETWEKACVRYDLALTPRRHSLPRDIWAALQITVDGWRDAHPAIVGGWWALQDAAIEAVSHPGQTVFVLNGRVRYLYARGFLWCSLPSSRVLAYFQPRIIETREIRINRNGEKYERVSRKVLYEGYEGETKRWTTQALYGGLQCDHVVQGTARDLLVDGMLLAEAFDYPTVLTVHDELLTEPASGSPDELRQLMSIVPPWAAGLPLAAKAWEDARYAK